jgi:hypothetical protein
MFCNDQAHLVAVRRFSRDRHACDGGGQDASPEALRLPKPQVEIEIDAEIDASPHQIAPRETLDPLHWNGG